MVGVIAECYRSTEEWPYLDLGGDKGMSPWDLRDEELTEQRGRAEQAEGTVWTDPEAKGRRTNAPRLMKEGWFLHTIKLGSTGLQQDLSFATMAGRELSFLLNSR
jgi:hypothetical protein